MYCLYWGLFFSRFDLPEPALDYDVEHPHVTFGFKKPFPDELMGVKATVKVIAYGNDSRNEGYRVELPEEYALYYDGAETPHITLALDYGAHAKDTAFIDFEELDQPFEVEGRFGFVAINGSLNC